MKIFSTPALADTVYCLPVLRSCIVITGEEKVQELSRNGEGESCEGSNVSLLVLRVVCQRGSLVRVHWVMRAPTLGVGRSSLASSSQRRRSGEHIHRADTRVDECARRSTSAREIWSMTFVSFPLVNITALDCTSLVGSTLSSFYDSLNFLHERLRTRVIHACIFSLPLVQARH